VADILLLKRKVLFHKVLYAPNAAHLKCYKIYFLITAIKLYSDGTNHTSKLIFSICRIEL